MKTKIEHNYELEFQDPPFGWIVYKSEKGSPNEKVAAYEVLLHAYGKEAHRCTCEFGMRQPNGQKIKRCKHVEMVLDEEFRMNRPK